ncbi:MAG TPA: hypothetical protein VF145_10600 [Chitinophagaceae bacterium]
MKTAELHLALTHVPVVLCFAALAMQVTAMLMRNTTVQKTALVMFVISGLVAIPVLFTGAPAATLISNAPGISSMKIEYHEQVAKASFILLQLAAVTALLALLFYKTEFGRFLRATLLVSGFITAVALAQTAHTGGQIRHTEAKITGTTKPKPAPQKSMQQLEEEAQNESHEIIK